MPNMARWCCCGECEPVDPGDECYLCEDITPLTYTVTFSGIVLTCSGCTKWCQGGGGDTRSVRYDYVNGFDPNDSFRLSHNTGGAGICGWSYTYSNGVRFREYSDLACNNLTRDVELDVIITLADQWTLNMKTEDPPGPIGTGGLFYGSVAQDQPGGVFSCATISTAFVNEHTDCADAASAHGAECTAATGGTATAVCP